MTSPFNFVRSVFGRGKGASVGGALSVVGEKGRMAWCEVVEPKVLTISEARHGFYCSLFDLPLDSEFAGVDSLSVPQKLIVEVVRNAFAEKEARTKSVPRLPSIIPKLMRSFRDPDAAPRDFVGIVNKDPTLSAGVLRLANSVYFNPTPHRIDSIEIAVVKLGIDGLRAVLTAAVMQPVVQRQSTYFSHFGHKLWEHTLACAVACEIAALQRGMEPYKAYLLGLTHEVGKITLFSELCKQFQRQSGSETPPAAAFIASLQAQSDSLSAAIAMDWELPREIISALQQQIELSPGSRVDPMAQLLFQANLVCEAHLIHHHNPQIQINLPAVARELSFPESIFADLRQLSMQV